MLLNALTKTVLFPAFIIISFHAVAQQPSIKVTLLGTGAPVPVVDRLGPSILVEAGNQKLLFDCGRGAAQNMAIKNSIERCKRFISYPSPLRPCCRHT